MKAVNRSIAQLRAPGERANADLKNRQLLRKIRSSPTHATLLVNGVQVLILMGWPQVGMGPVPAGRSLSAGGPPVQVDPPDGAVSGGHQQHCETRAPSGTQSDGDRPIPDPGSRQRARQRHPDPGHEISTNTINPKLITNGLIEK
jgi:hypothetical protein